MSKPEAIFSAFLIILCTIIFWLFPVTEGSYAFKTDLREDNFTVATGIGETTGNVTLQKVLYQNDVSTIDILSDTSADNPLYSSYNGTTRALVFTGLSDNLTREITVSYDIQAPGVTGTVATVADKFGGSVFLMFLIVFPIAAILAMFFVRR